VGCEKADGVVAPVVGLTAGHQVMVIEVMLHRHQFHRGDPDAVQVVDDHRMRQTGIGPAQLYRNVGMAHRQSPHVCLVDHRLVIRPAWRAIDAPVEVGIDHHAFGEVRRRVGGVDRVRVSPLVPEQRFIPGHRPVDRFGVWIQEQLGRIAAQPRRRVMRTVHTVGIPLPRADAGQITVPNKSVNLWQLDLPLTARLIEQTQHHAIRDLGEHREIRASAVIGSTKWVSISRPHLHVDMMARGSTDLPATRQDDRAPASTGRPLAR
jgi:hypothetical protein